ncbi:DNA polymerase [Leifsonia sp. EB34]|uniref:DNA polymerase n=1 Tax=Leifsonia sp. EB34 TaxID=3156303 RepID=UPI003514AB36
MTGETDRWLLAYPGPLGFEVSSKTESVRLTDHQGAVLRAEGAGAARELIDAVDRAGRRLWAAHAALQQGEHGQFLAQLGTPRVHCATTVSRALGNPGVAERLAPGRDTAAAMLSYQQSPIARRQLALQVEQEDNLWRAVSRRGYRLDLARLASERQTRERELDQICRQLSLDMRANQQVHAAWLAAHGIRVTRTDEPGWTHPSKCDTSQMAASFQEGWELYTRGHSVLKRTRILNGVSKLRDHGGRVHPIIETNSAVTGRMSIRSPGLQGWPAELRGILLAEPGTTVIAFDHSSAEMKVLARLIDQPSFTRKVTETDIYTSLAERLGATRKQAKVVLIAYTYGRSQTALAELVGVEQARAYHDAISSLVPEVVCWVNEQTRRARQREPLQTLFGRPLPPLTGQSRQTRFSKASNLLVQGSARDAFGVGIRRTAESLGVDALWIPMHDELFVLAPTQKAAAVAQALSAAMTVDLGEGVSLTGEAKILGDRWGKSD